MSKPKYEVFEKEIKEFLKDRFTNECIDFYTAIKDKKWIKFWDDFETEIFINESLSIDDLKLKLFELSVEAVVLSAEYEMIAHKFR